MKRTIMVAALLTGVGAFTLPLYSHCEVPCGIYDDPARIKAIEENITTIEKAIKQIQALSKAEDKNYNQIVRWINTKEKHATELQHIVTQYFLTQRVKPTDPADKAKRQKYLQELELLHHLLVYAMKTKQTTDLTTVAKLRETTAAFAASYLGEKTASAHEHSHAAPHDHTH